MDCCLGRRGITVHAGTTLSLAQLLLLLLLLLLAMLSSGLLAYDRLVLSKPIDQRAPGGIGEFNIGVPAAHFKMMQMRASDIHRRVALSPTGKYIAAKRASATAASVALAAARKAAAWSARATAAVRQSMHAGELQRQREIALQIEHRRVALARAIQQAAWVGQKAWEHAAVAFETAQLAVRDAQAVRNVRKTRVACSAGFV